MGHGTQLNGFAPFSVFRFMTDTALVCTEGAVIAYTLRTLAAAFSLRDSGLAAGTVDKGGPGRLATQAHLRDKGQCGTKKFFRDKGKVAGQTTTETGVDPSGKTWLRACHRRLSRR